MKVIVSNKDEYIKFYEGLLDELHTSKLTKRTKNYIINEVELGKIHQDVSVIDKCINNLLEQQYEKDQYIELEEIQVIDELICNLSKEECNILNSYFELKRFNIDNLEEIKELINNINDYKLIDVFDLYELGKMIVNESKRYSVSPDLVKFINYIELARKYLSDYNIKENFCSHGLLVNTREMLDNDLIQPKLGDKLFKIELVNKKEYEETDQYTKVIIYLPTSSERLKEKFERINLDYDDITIQDTHVIKCEMLANDKSGIINFNHIIKDIIQYNEKKGYSIPFQEINYMCNLVEKLSETEMSKFLAILDTKDIEQCSIRDLIDYTKYLEDYKLLDDVKNAGDLGKYLVHKTETFNDIEKLRNYINYYMIGNEYIKKNSIHQRNFTSYGYLMKKEDLKKNKEILKEKEAEEEFE